MKRIAIFASGSGSNAENIYHYFKHHKDVQIDLILTNNPNAGVIERAQRLDIPCLRFNRFDLYSTEKITEELLNRKIDLIVLAGFLWLLPSSIIQLFPNKIINIHPALLPKYGGKGMYGDFVHQAVSKANESETGITIHYVNEFYDEGAVIFQKSVAINPGEDPELIAQKVHTLEYEYFPKLIDDLLSV
jgi:phosphoribosylglycinamide formyltransferase-1